MKRAGFLATAEPRSGESSGAGPVRLLLAGVGLVIIGIQVFADGVLDGFSQMDRAGGPDAIFLVAQWVGFLSIAGGAVMVASSFVWWTWRIARHIRQRRRPA